MLGPTTTGSDISCDLRDICGQARSLPARPTKRKHRNRGLVARKGELPRQRDAEDFTTESAEGTEEPSGHAHRAQIGERMVERLVESEGFGG